MKKGVLVFSIITLVSSLAIGQIGAKIKKQVPHTTVYKADIVDATYGITIYERLNPMIDGDSTRMCDGYACEGWIEDKYENGNIVHKGYYVEGQLKIYKNYFPDGTLEREFKAINTFSAVSKAYFPDASLKSQVKYVQGSPLIWSDYYETGQLEYYEEYHKSFDYHIAKRSYFKNGKPSELFELMDKKKLRFDQSNFFASGTKKLFGKLVYDKKIYDYRKVGTWNYYKEDGSIDKTEKFE